MNCDKNETDIAILINFKQNNYQKKNYQAKKCYSNWTVCFSCICVNSPDSILLFSMKTGVKNPSSVQSHYVFALVIKLDMSR